MLKDGVSYKNGKLDFDLNQDWYDDIILLHKQGLNNKAFSKLGITAFFGYVLTKPESFNQKDISNSRNSIRTLIKNYDKLSGEDLNNVTKLVDESIKKLNDYKPLNSFDLVVSVESTAPLNKYLIQKIKPFLKTDVLIVDDLFVKNTIGNIDLDWAMLDRENSEKTKEQILTLFDRIIKSKNAFFIKDLRAGFRRYFINFLKFKDDQQKIIFEHILGKSLLLIDDSVGEMSTFRDMVRLLSMYKPKEYLCYAFLKDY